MCVVTIINTLDTRYDGGLWSEAVRIDNDRVHVRAFMETFDFGGDPWITFHYYDGLSSALVEIRVYQ